MATRLENLNTAYDAALAAYNTVLAQSLVASAAYATAVADWAPDYNIDGQQVSMGSSLASLATQSATLSKMASQMAEDLAKLRAQICDEEGPFEVVLQGYTP